MIKLTDATLLAVTKLRTRKIRTIITILLASLLFGVLVAGSLIVSGALKSADSFSKDGLTSRYIVSVNANTDYNKQHRQIYNNPELVKKAKDRYEKLVKEKTSEAKRLGVPYNHISDQPPYYIGESSEKETMTLPTQDQNGIVREILTEIYADQPYLDDAKLATTAKRYRATSIFTSRYFAPKQSSSLEVFENGKEVFYNPMDEEQMNTMYTPPVIQSELRIAPVELTKPFMLANNAGWKASDGTLPIILPLNAVERLLNLKEPPNTASALEKLNHLKKVKKQAEDLTFQACYRNAASIDLIQQALQQQKEMKAGAKTKDYEKPKLIYALPDPIKCENVTISSDTRTVDEKKQAENQKIFDEKFNNKGGSEPVSYFTSFKVVGISPPDESSNSSQQQNRSIDDIIHSILKTSGVGQMVPKDLYDIIPNKEKYLDLFTYEPMFISGNEDNRQRFVEFANAKDATKFIDEQSCQTEVNGSCAPAGRLYQAYLSFSDSVALNDVKEKTTGWFNMAILAVVALAAVIMWITVGRTITDGRRETAIFRAIGFKRIDITLVYIIYTIALSLLTAIVAAGIGFAGAYFVNQAYAPELTTKAQYIFGGLNIDKEFSLLEVNKEQLAVIFIACLATGLLSMILPLIRNVRRNPIKDMSAGD